MTYANLSLFTARLLQFFKSRLRRQRDSLSATRFLLHLGHKRGSLCQAFLAGTVETGSKNHCVIEATHVKRRKLRKYSFSETSRFKNSIA